MLQSLISLILGTTAPAAELLLTSGKTKIFERDLFLRTLIPREKHGHLEGGDLCKSNMVPLVIINDFNLIYAVINAS